MQDLFNIVKSAADGQWPAILTRYFAPHLLDGREHPCPKCSKNESDTRFGVFRNDFEKTGGVTCRRCFSTGADGIAAVAWILGCTQIDAAKRLAEDLGIDLAAPANVQLDPIDVICRSKRMPRESLELFGPLEVTKYGRERIDVIKLPVYNERGEAHSHFFISAQGKGYCAKGKGNSGLFLPGRLPTEGEIWLITEGVKDAAALVSLGYANVCGMPTNYLAAGYAPLFNGVDVVLVPDLDNPSFRGAQRTGGNLCRIAKSIRVARMPGEVLDSRGDGVREVLVSSGSDAIRTAIDKSEPWQPRIESTDDRPEVTVTLEEGRVTERVCELLGRLGCDSPWIPQRLQDDVAVYQRGGVLCQTLEVETEDEILAGGVKAKVGMRRIRPIPEPILRERITQACRLIEDRSTAIETKFVPIKPPKWLVSSAHVRGQYPKVRHLAGCVDTPVLRIDGSLLDKPGYDERSRLLYQPRCEFPVIGKTFEEAVNAATELEEVILDFPFKSSADRSVWLALLLTLVGRSVIPGCIPLFAVGATTPGSGKTLLINAAHIIAKGCCIAVRNYERDDREMKKAITSIVMEGIPAVLLDNIATQMGGPSLDALLTSTVWSDRILGESRTTGDLPLRTVWTCTGNNLRFGSDLGRRVLPLLLETRMANPEQREEFHHADLFGWIHENRPRLASAALTILRAYLIAGSPSQGGTWGSYEGWYRTIRNAIVWIGWTDPMETRRSMAEVDETSSLMKLIIAGLHEVDPYRRGMTAREIGDAVDASDSPGKCPSLLEAVHTICGKSYDARKFGNKLRLFAGRIVDDETIICRTVHGGVKRWSVGIPGSAAVVAPDPEPVDPYLATEQMQSELDLDIEDSYGGWD